MENNTPSLSDLIALWLSESHPELKLHVLDNLIADECGWIFGYITHTAFFHMLDKGLIYYQAADPEFFAKLEIGLAKMRESKVRLYQVAKMPETPPVFSIAE